MNIVNEFRGLGNCNVCGEKTILRVLDQSTGLRVGICCIEELRRADALLSATANKTGISHPTPDSHK